MALSDSVGLLFKISANADDAVRDLKKAEAGIKDVGAAGVESGAGLSSMAGPAAIAATAVLAIAAAAAKTVVTLFNLTKEAADFGSAIYDSTQKTGASAQTMLALKTAAEQSGSSFEQITGAVVKFNILLGESKNGNEKATQTLRQYGVTASDTNTALAQAIKTVASMTDVDKQAAAAKALFKDRTAEILPVIKSFDGDLPGLIKHMEELGITMSDQDAKAADEFGDQMDTLSAQLAGTGRTIGFALMPIFLNMAKTISAWIATNKVEVADFGARLFTLFDNLIRGFNRVKNWIIDNQTYLRIAAAFLTAGSSEIALAALKGIGAGIDEVTRPRATTGSVTDSGSNNYAGGYTPPPNVKTGRRAKERAVRDTSESDAAKAARDAEREADRAERERVNNARKYYQQETTYFEAEAKKRYAIAAEYADKEGRTDEDMAKFREFLDGEVLNVRKKNLAAYIAVLIGGTEEYKDAEEEMRLLELQIETTRSENAKKQQDRDKKAREDQEKLLAGLREAEGHLNDSGHTVDVPSVSPYENLNRALDELHKRMLAVIGLKNILASFGEIGVDAMQGMAQATGNAVEQWALYGGSLGKALRQALAAELAHIAGIATVNALYATALGFMRLAMWDFVGAGNAFTSAAIWAGLAGVSALGARAIAPKKEAQAASSSFAGASTGGGGRNGGSVFSSQGNDATVIAAGRNAPSSAMSIGLNISVRDRTDWFSQAFVMELEKNGRMKQALVDAVSAST